MYFSGRFLSRGGQGRQWVVVQLQVSQKLCCVKGTIPSERCFSPIVWEALNSRSKPSDGTLWGGLTEGERRSAFLVLQLYLLLVVLYADQLLDPLVLTPNSHHSRRQESSLVASCSASLTQGFICRHSVPIYYPVLRAQVTGVSSSSLPWFNWHCTFPTFSDLFLSAYSQSFGVWILGLLL